MAARPGRSVAAKLPEGEPLRGQHHAGTKNTTGRTGVVVGSIMIGLLILLAVVIILAMR